MKKHTNFLKISKFKIIILLTALLLFYTSFCALSYANNISSNISDNVFRLHVIANSDSKEDQNLKYKVRDSLINYMNDICKDCKTKQEAKALIITHQNEFKQIASDTVRDEGYNYNINLEIGNFEFPTKKYGDISLPYGFYDALKVKIGDAQGCNWWCVMFPPLCFVDISSGIVPNEAKEYLKENLSEEEFALISDNSNETIKFKFKLLEFLNQNGLVTAKK